MSRFAWKWEFNPNTIITIVMLGVGLALGWQKLNDTATAHAGAIVRLEQADKDIRDDLKQAVMRMEARVAETDRARAQLAIDLARMETRLIAITELIGRIDRKLDRERRASDEH